MKLCFRDCNRSRVVSTYLYGAFDCMFLSGELVFSYAQRSQYQN